MALFHRATLTPTKIELIAGWAPARAWGPAPDVAVESVGSFRFDDPEGRVGMETHLVVADGTLLHALERLLPFAAEKAGFEVAAAHVPGCAR